MATIRATITVSGTPTNGLTDDPEITIRRLDTGAAVVTGSPMTDEGADGLYTFDFTPVAGLLYSFLIDADPNANGNVPSFERYYDGAFDNEVNDMWRDRALDPSFAKTIDDNGVADDADIDEDVAAGGNSPAIHKDVLTVGNVTTATRT